MNTIRLIIFISSALTLSVFASESPQKLQKSVSKQSASPRSALSASLPNLPKTEPIDIPNSSGNNRLRASENITSRNLGLSSTYDRFNDEDYTINPLSHTYTEDCANFLPDDNDSQLLIFPYAFAQMGYSPSPQGTTPNSLKPSR